MKIFSFSLMMSLTLTLLTVGVVTTLGTQVQTAEAKRNCTPEGDTCAGGQSFGTVQGGSGGRLERSDDEFEKSGGFGAGPEGTDGQGGEGGRLTCDLNDEGVIDSSTCENRGGGSFDFN